MYAIDPIKGDHLPDKTLCLTYDDGPGEHTLPIARYLFEKGIKATFFVVGKYAVDRQSVLSRLVEMGHTIGNHTYDHPDLPYYVSINGDLQSQILQTDTVIKPFTTCPVFFRAPYGKWTQETANELNIHLPTALNHLGPIHWDIDGIDCYYWRNGKSVGETVACYKKMIEEAGKGIVVMHDDISDMDTVKPLNQTLALTQQLIPMLLAEGYRFIGLAEAMDHLTGQNSFQVYLKVGKKQIVTLHKDVSSKQLILSAKEKTIFRIEEWKDGKIALRTPTDKYLCLANDNQILALTDHVVPHSSFDLIPVFDNRFLLRTYSGNFINVNSDTGMLEATAAYMRLATTFSYQPLQVAASKPITLSMQYKLWKKRLAFIRSKLFSR